MLTRRSMSEIDPKAPIEVVYELITSSMNYRFSYKNFNDLFSSIISLSSIMGYMVIYIERALTYCNKNMTLNEN